jgi:hypothetical protein
MKGEVGKELVTRGIVHMADRAVARTSMAGLGSEMFLRYDMNE